MKITKFFVAALASLAMFSCSNDEEMTNDSKHQNTALSVSVANIMNGSRAVGDLAEAKKVWVNGTATLTIEYKVGDVAKTATATLKFNEGECTDILPDEGSKAQMTTSKADKKVTLWNAGTVSKVSVTINGGVNEIAPKTSINDKVVLGVDDENKPIEKEYVNIPAKQIPAYAEAVPTLSGNQGTFNTGGDNGAASPDYKNYYYYEVALQLVNKEFARIELSDIYYAEPDETSKFSELKLTDVVLDNAVQKKGEAATKLDFAKADMSTVNWGFYHDALTENNDMLQKVGGEGEKVPVRIPGMVDGKTQSYAYNIWAGQKPTLRLHFHAVGKDQDVAPDQWAFVTEYNDESGNPIDKFEAGTIYRITSAKLVDKNIVPDPEGDKRFAVVVTVKPVKWSVVDVNATWHENN